MKRERERRAKREREREGKDGVYVLKGERNHAK